MRAGGTAMPAKTSLKKEEVSDTAATMMAAGVVMVMERGGLRWYSNKKKKTKVRETVQLW